MSTLIERVRAKTGFDSTQISDDDLNLFVEESQMLFEQIAGLSYVSSVLADAIISDFVSGTAYNRVNGVDGIKNYRLGKLSVTKFNTQEGVNHFFKEGLKKLKEYIGLGIKASEYTEEEITKPDKVMETSVALEE